MQLEMPTLVTFNPLAVTAEMSLSALLPFTQDTERAWPVVDDERRLEGMLYESHIAAAVERIAAELPLDVGSMTAIRTYENCTVGQLMDRAPATLSSDATPIEAIRLMGVQQFRTVPVVDGEQLIGIVTPQDLIREFSFAGEGMRALVVDSMDPVDELVDSDSGFDEVMRQMDEGGVDFVGVLQGDFPLGVLCRNEIRIASCWQKTRERLGDLGLASPDTVAQLATSAPHIRPGQPLREAAGRMVEFNRGAIAAINQAGRMLGVVTAHSILKRLQDLYV